MAVESGSTVTINFVGRLDDGSVFDTTYEGGGCGCGEESCEDDSCGPTPGPYTFTLGAGAFFPAVEEALLGLNPGDRKSVTVPARDAFGEYDEELVFHVPTADLPEGMDPEVGDEFVLTNENDEDVAVVVIGTDDEGVTFDANHPLAGEDLHFEIELVSVA